ncbi:MAG: thiamine-phosphate kinase [Acidobacteria bacterium]|jgi:thiamine-monophosphate kinase|nr:thiamine-phosphate kinase [Acidobacteriota bacterium]
MDERRFVDFLEKKFPFRRGLGIGDDASVVRCGKSFQLISTDLLVEDVHFRLSDVPLAALAEKALAVNVSDIAAMGGRAQYFYLGLGFPPRLGASALRRFFSGLSRAARRWEVELAGGDYSRSRQMLIAITIVGASARPVRRSGARAGDWVGITGPTGESALGLKLLLAGETRSPFILRHQHPRPQCEKGLRLSAHASAMIDVSDGLLLDLSRLLRASGVGAEIDYEKLPMAPGFRRLCRQRRFSERDLVLAGGEDYQLLFTVPPQQEPRLRRTGTAYHLIGRVSARRGLRLRENGRPLRVTKLGFDHFSAAPGR